MLTLQRPNNTALAALVERCRTAPLSYSVGLLDRVGTERRWFVDRHHAVIGHGITDFELAKDALREWIQFRQSWTVPALPLAPIEAGATVGYSARAVGLWWSYCCQIVETIDEPHHYGFIYGTVQGHAERGEERFLVTHDPATEEVTYQLFAMSRPGRWFTWCGLPIGRLAQAKFRRGSTRAIQAFIAAGRQARMDHPL